MLCLQVCMRRSLLCNLCSGSSWMSVTISVAWLARLVKTLRMSSLLQPTDQEEKLQMVPPRRQNRKYINKWFFIWHSFDKSRQPSHATRASSHTQLEILVEELIIESNSNWRMAHHWNGCILVDEKFLCFLVTQHSNDWSVAFCKSVIFSPNNKTQKKKLTIRWRE